MGAAELATSSPSFYQPLQFNDQSGIPNWRDAKHYADADAWNVASGDAMDAFEAGSGEGMRRLRDIAENLGKFSGADASQRAMSYAKFVQNYMNGTGASFKEAMDVKQQVEEDMKAGKKPGGKKGGKGKGEGEELTPEEVELSRTEFFKYLFKKKLKLDQLLDETTLERNNRGRIRRRRKMRNMGEISKVRVTEFGSPVLIDNILSKNMSVDERFKRVSHKKVSFVLLDDSGSMSSPKKQGVLRAVTELLADNCEEMYIACYVEEAEHHQRIKGHKDLKKYLKKVYSAAHGNTEIGYVLSNLSEQLKQGKFGHLNVDPGPNPQIVIILDGQDDVFPVPGLCAVHAVSIGQHNGDLQKLCLTSSGSYQYVP